MIFSTHSNTLTGDTTARVQITGGRSSNDNRLDDTSPTTAEEWFEKLDSVREQIKRKWRDMAALTIPSIMFDEGINEETEFDSPFQSLGARLVNTLASKLSIALLPPSTSFYKLQVDQAVIEELSRIQPGVGDKVNAQLLKDTNIIDSFIDGTNARVTLFQLLRKLIVIGNGLPHVDDDGAVKIYAPVNYVVIRDGSGTPTTVILRELINPITIKNKEKREFITTNGEFADPTSNSSQTNRMVKDSVELFTAIELLPGGKKRVFQETGGLRVPGSEVIYTKGNCPFLPPMTWSLIQGENYGRSHVEDHLGDFRSYEGFTQLIYKGTGALAKVNLMVDPNGNTNPDDVSDSETGEVIIGSEGDVTVLQGGQKAVDLRIAQELMRDIAKRLSEAFLLNSSVTRDAERVTAEEIRLLAQELDEALGGTFSNLREWQFNYLLRLMTILRKKKKISNVDKEKLQPKIITGIEALGRGAELQKLINFLDLAARVPGFEEWLNTRSILDKIGDKAQVDTSEILKDEQQVAQERQAAQQAAQEQAMTEQAAGPLAKAAGDLVTQS